jgi:hypothetical protein
VLCRICAAILYRVIAVYLPLGLIVSQLPTALDPNEVETLLGKLCVDLGFCLPPDAQDRLIENPPGDTQAFTDAVFVAEGMNPQTARRELYRQVRDCVAAAFAQAAMRGELR